MQNKHADVKHERKKPLGKHTADERIMLKLGLF
jgi:hypothetical protein